eukprot:1888554-Prymnesium_polylepis.2
MYVGSCGHATYRNVENDPADVKERKESGGCQRWIRTSKDRKSGCAACILRIRRSAAVGSTRSHCNSNTHYWL